MARRKPTFQERTTACGCCAHPLSQRHHLWEFAEFGENSRTVPLCASCHDLYHIMVKALVEESPWYLKLLDHYIEATSVEDSKFKFLYILVRKGQDEKKQVGQNSAFLVLAIEERMRQELGDGIAFDFLQERQPYGDPVEKGGSLTALVTGRDRDGKDATSAWKVTYEGYTVTDVRKQ